MAGSYLRGVAEMIAMQMVSKACRMVYINKYPAQKERERERELAPSNNTPAIKSARRRHGPTRGRRICSGLVAIPNRLWRAIRIRCGRGLRHRCAICAVGRRPEPWRGSISTGRGRRTGCAALLRRVPTVCAGDTGRVALICTTAVRRILLVSAVAPRCRALIPARAPRRAGTPLVATTAPGRGSGSVHKRGAVLATGMVGRVDRRLR